MEVMYSAKISSTPVTRDRKSLDQAKTLDRILSFEAKLFLGQHY